MVTIWPNFWAESNMATFYPFWGQLWLAMNQKISWPLDFENGHIGHGMATVGNTELVRNEIKVELESDEE